VFAGKAFKEGLGQGKQDARFGREKSPHPAFWKALVSRSHYSREFNRGYNAGYETVCRGEVIQENRERERATIEERKAALESNRNRTPERDDERSL